MKIKVLVDNNTLIDRYFFAEPGVSFLIEDDGVKIIFDVGYSDVFMKNAHKMNISLYDIDYAIISHGHNDHTWGLMPLINLYSESKAENIRFEKPTLIAHPDAFLYKEFGPDEEIGSIIKSESLGRYFDMKLSRDPVWITKNIVFLGEIERKNDFENKEPIGKYKCNGVMKDDYLIDDTALVYKSSEGLVIITGCSHAGICNIIEYAKQICDDNRIVDIIGGFHLLNPSKKQLLGTVEYMKKENIREIHACHCTDLQSKIELSKVVDLKEVGVGLLLKYD